jgi:23S rRNA (cytidine1920-2'-O)/16S rRNA (cytidine1409-2'-O)-methyltransferase
MSESKRADRLLVEQGHFESRERAKAAIEAGLVTSDGAPVTKPSAMLRPGAVIDAASPHPYVSRGGVKLDAALDAFAFKPEGLVCLDIGASTGGFSQVLLQRNARKVVAVDVGHAQLHASLAGEPRLMSFEGQDIRTLSAAAIGEAPALITVDVSFISLSAVLPAATKLAGPRAMLVALIKPQFELGRAHRKKGIVRDATMRERACGRIEALLGDLGWTIRGLIPSPIVGGDGNREHLIGARRG